MNANVNQKNENQDNEKVLEMKAYSSDFDANTGDVNINVEIHSNCKHVGEDLRLLETATCAYFLKALPRVHEDDRESLVNQYVTRVRTMLLGAVGATKDNKE